MTSDRSAQARAALLFVAHVTIREPGVGRDDLHQAVRGVARQCNLVDAFPNADALFGGLQPLALLG